MRTIKLCATTGHQHHRHVTLREAIQRAERRIELRSGRPAGSIAGASPSRRRPTPGHGTTGPLH